MAAMFPWIRRGPRRIRPAQRLNGDRGTFSPWKAGNGPGESPAQGLRRLAGWSACTGTVRAAQQRVAVGVAALGRDGTEEAARDNMEMRAEPVEAKALLRDAEYQLLLDRL